MSAITTPVGARWSCHGCGLCCRVFQLGPVEPAILQNLHDSGVTDWWPPAAAQPIATLRPGPQGPQAFFTKVDGACIFLGPDQRCAIHARLGPAAKPGFCREYPFHFAEDPLGTVAAVRADCGGQPQGDDEAVADLAPAHRDLPRPGPILTLPEGEVPLVPGLGVPALDLAHFVRDQDRALAAKDADPDALIAQLRAAAAAHFGLRFPAADPARAEAAFQRLAAALHGLLAEVLAAGAAPSAAEGALVSTAAAAVAQARSVPSPARYSPPARAHANEALRGALLTHQVLGQGSVGAGLGLYSLLLELSARGPEEVDRATLITHLSRLLRLAAHPAVAQLLRAHRGALLERFVHAGL